MLFPFETGEMELTVSRCTRANVPKGGRVSGERRSGVGGQFVQLLIRHGLLQSPDAVQLEPVEGLRHLSPSKVYE